MKNIKDILCNAFCIKECSDIDYLNKRIESLSAELSHCIGPMLIIEEQNKSINPHKIISGYDMVIADAEYHTYTVEDWTTIMYRLHKHFGNKVTYKTNVSDCDDFALLYASTVAYSAYRAGLSNQPAFAIAWSNTHAFNLFIASNNTVWLYEPQNGNIIGLLGSLNGDAYDVKKIWFLS